MSLGAVVFDLDYTLVVPTRDRQTLLDEATAAAGVRNVDRQEYLDAHGSDLASETRAPIFDALLDEGDPEEVAGAYRRAVNDAPDATPGQTVHVGDHPEADVRGAAEAGLVAVQVVADDAGRVPEADAYVRRDGLADRLRDLLLREESLP